MHCPVLPCWYSSLGDVAALGRHSADTGDPSSQASGDTKRHYNDGGGIKQVREAHLPLADASFRPTLDQPVLKEPCLNCHITGGRLRVSHGMKHSIIILLLHHGNLLFQAGALHKKLPTPSRMKHMCVLLGDGFRG